MVVSLLGRLYKPRRRSLSPNDHKACLQVTTEGDAFHLAFHDPIDAVGWALNVQQVALCLSHSCCHPTKFNISAIVESD